MLIRVVRAVNDFILAATFSGKGFRSGARPVLPRRFLLKRDFSGEGCALSVISSPLRDGFGPALYS
jgi:hypothetical protein